LLGLGNETHRDRLFPFGRLEIEQIARAWSGPLTVIVDASFGGALLQGEAVDADEVSLLLAAREPNGLVFEERQGLADSQANLVASPLMEVFEQGIDDPPTDPTIIAARERYQKLFSGNSSWVVGTPIWIPRWTRSGASTARMQLEPLSRWASLVAHSCAQRALDECEGLVSGSVGPEARDAFVLLSSVAGADLSGAVGKSIRKYQAAADSLSRLATASNSDFPGTTDARAALERAASAVRLRAESAASSDGRRVHILSFAVEDYQSPLIARLPGTTRDLDAYAQAIKAVLSVPATEVVVDRKIASTAKEVLDALRTARKEVENRPQDLIIVIFSGRGIELNGRRYLAPASVVPNISESPAQLADAQAPVIAWDTDELIDIWQIADIMQGRWFLGIYDVQFTSPVLEARADQLLDKHLDSVRPQVQGASSLGADANRMKGNQGGASVMLRRGDVPARQVHIWVDGRLTPAVKPPHPCIKDPQSIAVSPLATAIALSLHSGHPGTYRNWMTALAQEECLHATKGDLTLTFQGDLDVPAFGSGEGAQFVEYFRNGDIRRETNLRAAAGVANDAMHRFPIVRHKLARAALLVSLIELFNDRQEILQMTEEQEKWTQEARSLLESLTFEQMGSEDSAALWPMRIELLVRLYQLRHDPGAALRVLQEAAPVEVLLDRGLTRRLVDATQAAINQQSTSVFESSATILLTLQKAQTNPASQTEVDAATRGLNVLKNAERERRSEPFSLKPPTVPTSDSGALPSEKGASP
jgi:hypothetical protein